MSARGLTVRRLGRRSYADARALQEAAARAVTGGGLDQLLYVEHPPVVTLGRAAAPGQLVATVAELCRRGIAVVETDRGGGATFHGPGQLVGYPIVDLRRRGLGVRAYLRALEAGLVRALRLEGVDGGVRPGLTGVWSTAGKLASIGIAVRRGISRHGFALNVDPDLSCFGLIVPCGLSEPVTAMRALGWDGEVPQLMNRLAATLGRTLEEATSAPVRTERAGAVGMPLSDAALSSARGSLPWA